MTDKSVMIYSTPTCPYCKRAKAYFTEKEIEFTDIDVAADKERAKEMIEKSGQMGVPVIYVGDTMIIGFNQSKIDEALAAE
jgi:glutaredoxin-like YruB-family protein